MDKIKQYQLFFLIAFMGHLSILGLFSLNYHNENPVVKVQSETPEIIQASLLDETRVIQKAKELKQAQETKKRLQQKQKDNITRQIKKERQLLQAAKDKRKKEESKAKQDQQVERKRLAKLKKTVALEKKKQAAIKQKKIAVEKKRQVDAKRLKDQQEKALAIKKAAEKQQKIAAEKKRVADAEKLRLQKITNENKRIANAKAAKERAVLQAKNAKIAKQAVASAAMAIDRKVTQAWNRPSNMTGKLSCQIKVNLLPTGDVMSASIGKSSGSAVFDASAERAVYKASPLPVSKDKVIFERNFRSFRFNFAPK